MSILSFLFPSSPESSKQWSQTQLEALVDFLYFAIYADNHLSQLEEIAIKDELTLVDWQGDASIDMYVNDAIKRARDAKSNPEAKADYLRDIAARLGTDDAKTQALETCRKVLESDGSHAREESFLSEAEAAFAR